MHKKYNKGKGSLSRAESKKSKQINNNDDSDIGQMTSGGGGAIEDKFDHIYKELGSTLPSLIEKKVLFGPTGNLDGGDLTLVPQSNDSDEIKSRTMNVQTTLKSQQNFSMNSKPPQHNQIINKTTQKFKSPGFNEKSKNTYKQSSFSPMKSNQTHKHLSSADDQEGDLIQVQDISDTSNLKNQTIVPSNVKVTRGRFQADSLYKENLNQMLGMLDKTISRKFEIKQASHSVESTPALGAGKNRPVNKVVIDSKPTAAPTSKPIPSNTMKSNKLKPEKLPKETSDSFQQLLPPTQIPMKVIQQPNAITMAVQKHQKKVSQKASSSLLPNGTESDNVEDKQSRFRKNELKTKAQNYAEATSKIVKQYVSKPTVKENTNRESFQQQTPILQKQQNPPSVPSSNPTSPKHQTFYNEKNFKKLDLVSAENELLSGSSKLSLLLKANPQILMDYTLSEEAMLILQFEQLIEILTIEVSEEDYRQEYRDQIVKHFGAGSVSLMPELPNPKEDAELAKQLLAMNAEPGSQILSGEEYSSIQIEEEHTLKASTITSDKEQWKQSAKTVNHILPITSTIYKPLYSQNISSNAQLKDLMQINHIDQPLLKYASKGKDISLGEKLFPQLAPKTCNVQVIKKYSDMYGELKIKYSQYRKQTQNQQSEQYSFIAT